MARFIMDDAISTSDEYWFPGFRGLCVRSLFFKDLRNTVAPIEMIDVPNAIDRSKGYYTGFSERMYYNDSDRYVGV